jgi:hypothetical protein
MVLRLGTLKPILRTGGQVFRPKMDVLPTPQRFMWPQLGTVPRNFVLYGGTALALRLGHRQSVDFDFFCNEAFAPEQLFAAMNLPRDSRVDQRGDNTLSVFVHEVNLSFFGDVRMNRVHDPDVADNGLQVASLLDLIATKLKTIQQRAEAKDYQDLAAALRAGTKLEEALAAAIAVFGPKFNAIATLKALTYFEDGDLRTVPANLQKQLETAASAVDADALPELNARTGIVRE